MLLLTSSCYSSPLAHLVDRKSHKTISCSYVNQSSFCLWSGCQLLDTKSRILVGWKDNENKVDLSNCLPHSVMGSTATFRTTLNYWWTVQISFISSAKNLNLLFYIQTDPISVVSNVFYWRCLLNRYLSSLNIYYCFWNTWHKKRTFSKNIMQHCWLKHYLTHHVCFLNTQPFSNRNSPVKNILKFGQWRSFCSLALSQDKSKMYLCWSFSFFISVLLCFLSP